MKRSAMFHKAAHAAAHERRRVPLWLGAAIAAAVLMVSGLPAAAQPDRRIELIERALALEPNQRAGAALYREHCASCHGRRARGDARRVIPALAGQLSLYLIKQLVDVAEGERVSEMHRAVARKPLSTPRAIRDVAAYLSALARNPEPEVGDGTQLALGKRSYEGLCAFCHGAQGEGNEEHATPALQGQHYSYLLMQARLLSVGHRYSVDPTIAETLRTLSYDYLAAIADHASRLPTDTSEAAPGQPEGASATRSSNEDTR